MVKDTSLSQRLAEWITIVFGVVVALSFDHYKDIILAPWTSWLAFLSLLSVYSITVSSWIFYHMMVSHAPYTEGKVGLTRFANDFVVVGLYAYLLYTVDKVLIGEVLPYLIGYFLIFFFYLPNSLLGRGRRKSWPTGIIISLGLLGVITGVYAYMLYAVGETSTANWIFVVSPAIVNSIYRYLRWKQGW